MIEIKLELPLFKNYGLDLIRRVLVNYGIKDESIVETKEKNKTYLALYVSTLRHAKKIKNLIASLGIKHSIVNLRPLKDSQWKTRWKKYFQPIDLTPGICIVPAWLRKRRIKTNRKKVFIDTSVAFGTGLHPTTQMTALLIEKYRGQLGKFLDVGTGSGILSVIAHVYGAQEVWALDIDQQAVKTAEKNFKLNACTVRWVKPIDFNAFENAQQFDFIAANLITDDLIRFKKKLIANLCRGGYLAVSGIYKTNYAKFINKFRDRRICCLRTLKLKGWNAAIFRKK